MTSLDAHVVKWLELQLGVGGGGREEGRLWKSTTLRKDTCQLTLLYTKDKNLHHQRCSLTVTLKQGHQYPPLGNHGSTLFVFTPALPQHLLHPLPLSADIKVLIHWLSLKQCSWSLWMSLKSSWSVPHSGRGEVVCTPPSPIALNCPCWDPHVHTAVRTSLAAHSHSYLHQAPCGFPSSCHWGP